jgi:hypothetical protein
LVASGAADDRLVRIAQRIAMAVMLRRSAATEMRGRSRSLERHRKNGSDKRQQQQESGGPALHYLCRSEPQR